VSTPHNAPSRAATIVLSRALSTAPGTPRTPDGRARRFARRAVRARARSVNRSPLALGLLAGRYADHTRFDAQALGVDLGTQPRDGPIPGIRTVTQAEDNAAVETRALLLTRRRSLR
jgi:aryl-alcohol dehydrogenase-like predicted oxidoreductase